MIKGHIQLTKKRNLPEEFAKYKGKKIDFELPESWSEVTLGTFKKLSDDTDYLEMFSIFSGIGLDIIRACDPKTLEEIIFQMGDLFNPEQLNNLPAVAESFEIDGVKYVMNPNIAEETVGAWWDSKKLQSQLKEDPLKFISKMLAIYCRPEGEEYDYVKSQEREEIFDKVDVVTAFKLRNFFLSSRVLFLNGINHSSRKNTQLKRLWQALTRLAESLVHFLRSSISQKISTFLATFSGKKRR